MHAEKDAHIWKSPEIDRAEQEEIKKYTTKDHKVNMGLIICSYVLLNIDLPTYYQNYIESPHLVCVQLFRNISALKEHKNHVKAIKV